MTLVRTLRLALLTPLLLGGCDLLTGLTGPERDPRYRVIDIAPGDDGSGVNIDERYLGSRPHDVNAAGEVVGRLRQGEDDWVGFYFSEENGLVLIEAFDEVEADGEAHAMTLQDDGTVYGYADGHVQDNAKTPFSWTLDGGKVALSDDPEEVMPWASNADTVVGACRYNIRPCDAVGGDLFFPDTADLGEGGARGINDAGTIAGWWWTDVGGVYYDRPKIWRPDDEAPTDIGSLDGDPTSEGKAYAINNDGVVVGYSNGDDGTRPFRWTEELGMVELPLFDDNENTRYVDVMDDGTMVGGNGVQALILHDGEVTDLNLFIAADTGWQLEMAYAVNQQGWIAGHGTLDGEPHLFLLAPLED